MHAFSARRQEPLRPDHHTVSPPCALQVSALREAYGANASSTLPTTIQAGRGSASADAAPPPGSLLAAPVLLASAEVDSWQARFRCAAAALMLNAADFAGNPEAPEVLQPYGGSLDRAKVLATAAVALLRDRSPSRLCCCSGAV